MVSPLEAALEVDAADVVDLANDPQVASAIETSSRRTPACLTNKPSPTMHASVNIPYRLNSNGTPSASPTARPQTQSQKAAFISGPRTRSHLVDALGSPRVAALLVDDGVRDNDVRVICRAFFCRFHLNIDIVLLYERGLACYSVLRSRTSDQSVTPSP